MQFLAGHPLAIALAAPLLQDRTLGELHQTLEQKRIAALEVPGLTPNEHDVSTSLSVSLGASVDHLSRRDPDAFRLFVVLGLLPAGAVAENLDVIWGESWRLPMETLIRVSLVEKRLVGKLEYYSCFPFVASFAETLLTPQDREVYPSRVAVHFAQICNDIHETISSPEHKYADALLDLLEGNFWACFDDSRLGTPPDASGETAVGRIAYLLPATLVLAGRLQDAERAAARALQACIKWGDEWGRANALQALGEIQLSLGNVSQSSRNYEAALGIYQTLGHSLGEANTLEVMGQLCQRRRDVEGAIRYYDAALRIWQSEQRQRQVASILYLRGEVHANHGSYTAARNDYDRALQIFRDEDYKLGEANVLLLSGDLKGHLGDQHGKRVAYEEALPIYVQINDELGVANCSQGLGSVKKVQKDFEGACRDLELAIKLFKKQHRPLGHANSLTELGNVYTSAMFPESAAEPLFEALKIQVDIGNSLGVAAAIAQLAFTSSALKRHEAAVLLLERVLLLESESLHSKAIALAAQASEFATIGAASSAVVCTWSAREIFYRANHPAVEQMDAALAEYKLLLGSDQFDRLVSQLPECGRELRRAAVKEVDTRAGNDPWLKTVDKALAQIE
jgi:tetratricopeptide (TPR) repeat protein